MKKFLQSLTTSAKRRVHGQPKGYGPMAQMRSQLLKMASLNQDLISMSGGRS